MARRAPRQLTSSTGAITVDVEGAAAVHDMLAKWADPKALEARNQRATRAGAKVLAPPLRRSAAQHSSRMGRSVYIHQMRGNRSAQIVGHHKKKSSGLKGDFWPIVIGGSKDHGPRKAKALYFFSRKAGRNIRVGWVRGVRPAPIVEAVARAYGERAQQAMIAELEKGA